MEDCNKLKNVFALNEIFTALALPLPLSLINYVFVLLSLYIKSFIRGIADNENWLNVPSPETTGCGSNSIFLLKCG